MKNSYLFLKNSDPKRKFLVFNLFLFSTFLLLNLLIPYNANKWEIFPDCYDYLAQSKIDLFNLSFFFPTKDLVTFPRAFSIPLIYKLAGSDPQTIVLMQKIIYSFSVTFFSFCVSFIFKKDRLKYIWLFCSYLILANWENLGWSQTLLSESLGLSFFLLWLGSFVLYENKRTIFIMLAHFFFLILLSFSRDNMPYFVVVFYSGYFVLKLFIKERKTFAFTTLSISIIIFIIHSRSVEIGERHRLPLTNTIITRIIPNESYTAWFKHEGMPMTDSLKKNFKNIDPLNDSKVKVYNMYTDTSYNQFFDWAVHKGKSTYIKFMLTHLDYFFLVHEDWSKMNGKLFANNSFYYGGVFGYTILVSYITLLFNNSLFLVLLLPILILLYKIGTAFPYFLFSVIIFLIMILLNYNADTFEVGRHMYLNSCILELVVISGVLLIFDNSEKYHFFTSKKPVF